MNEATPPGFEPRTSYARSCWTIPIAIVISAHVLGCGALGTRGPIPDGPVSFGDNRGLLIVHIDTDILLGRVDAGRETIATDIEPGQHIFVVEAPARGYRWSEILVPTSWGGDMIFRLRREQQFQFEVHPGQISYPGVLHIRQAPTSRWGSAMYIRTFSRIGEIEQELYETFPELLEQFQITNGRVGRDDYFRNLPAVPAGQ